MMRIRIALSVSLALLTIGCRGNGSHKKTEQLAQPSGPVTSIDMGSVSEPKRLLRGFSPGDRFWKWTQRTFAVALDRPQALGSTTYFEMDFNLPHETLPQSGEAAVTVRANGLEVCRKT